MSEIPWPRSLSWGEQKMTATSSTVEKSLAGLLAQIRCGDQSAFATFERTHFQTIFKIIRRRFSPALTFQELQDAAQDALVKIWLNAPSYEERGLGKAWVFWWARNSAVNVLRKKRVIQVPLLEQIDPEQPAGRVAKVEAGIEEAYARREEEMQVMACMSRLSLRERLCVILHYHGLKDAQITDFLNWLELNKRDGGAISPKLVETIRRRSLRKIQKWVQEGKN
jgi:RNA polymerase sigma factor (sigma-70 family)